MSLVESNDSLPPGLWLRADSDLNYTYPDDCVDISEKDFGKYSWQARKTVSKDDVYYEDAVN